MKQENNWYDNPQVVDTLLFIAPPLGIYGLYRTQAIRSSLNKILYGLLGYISLLLVVISIY